MGFNVVTFSMAHVGDILNVFVCAFVVLFNLSFAYQLEAGCRERATNQEETAAWPVIVWSFWVWASSWFFWFWIYVIRLVGAGQRIDPGFTSPLVQLLSDLQSACIFIASYAILRAGHRGVTRDSCQKNLVMLLVATVILDALLYVNGLLVAGFGDADTLLRPWSMATSVFAPVAIGLALGLRYVSLWPLLWTGMYAFAQPFAYSAAFDSTTTKAVQIEVSNEVAVPAPLEAHMKLVRKDAQSSRYTYKVTGNSTTSKVVPIVVAKEVAISEPLQPYVRFDKDIQNGRYTYEVTRDAAEKRMTGRQVREVLALFEEQMEFPYYWGVYIQLRYDEIIFVFLAVMKLVLCATCVFYYRIKQADVEPNIHVSLPIVDHVPLVGTWRTYFSVFVGGAIVLLVIVAQVHGPELTVIFGLFGFVIGIVGVIRRGPRALWASFRKKGP
jgi:hypothetical protein